MEVNELLKRGTVTVPQAAEILGVSRGMAYAAAHEFEETGGARGLPVVRLGRRLLVPTSTLRQILKWGPVEWSDASPGAGR